eukprot:228513_1
MGGDPLPRQFIEYNILSDVMIDYGTHVMIDQGHPNEFGMYWSQYGNSLYVMRYGRLNLDVYDLSSSSNLSMITIQKGASNILGTSACVVASEHFLFVAGGWEYGKLRILNVLSLPNHVWSLGPEMMIARVNSGCALMPDNYLYVLGGGTAQNERILINDLQNQQWQPIESFDTTSNIFNYPGIAPYRDVIWVFGGRETQTGPDLDKIWNIYTNDVSSTGPSVSLLSESLPFVFSLVTGTMTIVQNVIYVFGDQSSIKYVISPTNPSNQPSETPSDNPSFNSTDASEDQDGTWMTYIVVVAIAITICLIIAVLLSCYFKEKTARQRTEHMISQEPRVEVTDHDDIECQDNDTECKDNDELYGERGDDEGSEHSNSEDLYDTQHVVATKGAMDCQMARRVNECTDCGQMEEVTEVNGLFYCAICREFIDDFDNEGDELYNAQSPKVTEGNTDGVECVDNDGHNQTMTAGSD